ncbi:Planctomycete cytochrome C [Planctomycetes bacterium Poly30]|uniref:Planctomycete cytochrome C n=1 Tax=Saltatorellus ferox TaxID=2528018 RepID=A0A518F0X3_9BACT|nr:Planctomycete cytochrome C [Planctomycetes bacterium Poly30]
MRITTFLAFFTLFLSAAASGRDPGTPELGTGDFAPGLGVFDTESLGPEDFTAVRRILETRCLECHGGAHRKSFLSFATAETFAEGGSRGDVLDRDRLEKSRLLKVIEYGNPELAMPKSGAIPDEEVAVLRAWILKGAPWPEGSAGRLADPSAHPLEEHHVSADGSWWAYGSLDRLEDPKVEDAAWAEHPVDAWIRASLDQAGFAPAERARPEALLRRATFALTGLPPTPAERHAFLAAVEDLGWEQAWSQLLDGLFASPHYGEAQARHWLDLVRYAETDGYERDSAKQNIWRYRDWVIRAFNRDLPYDRFVQLQLAGDEYAADIGDPFEAAEAQIATGFYRIGLFDDEPADREQAASDARADIVDTVSQVVFGTTMGCARCHDHKADPVTQKEYFALTAHFTGVTRYSKNGTRDLADRAGDGVWAPDAHADRLAEIDAALTAEVERTGLGTVVKNDSPVTLVADARAAAHEWLYRIGDAFQGDAWSQPGFDDASWKSGRSGFGAAGTPGAIVNTAWQTPVIQLRTTFRLGEIPSALHLTYLHDEDVQIYLNGQLILERPGYTTSYLARQLGADALAALVVGRNVLAVQCSQTAGGQAIDVGLSTKWDVEAEGGMLESVRVALGEAPADDQRFEGLRRHLMERDRHLAQPVAVPYPAHVAYENGPVPPEQFVEMRGSVHARGDRVDPALPEAWLVGQPAEAPAYELPAPGPGAASSLRRRTLADWAFEGGAHVTARVEANRIWQFLFGRGICRTSGDFGRLGELPTNAKLLDRVALELIDREWSVKSLQRWLMESEAYQMGTERDPVVATLNDPRNDLYSAFDPRRLTAEEYRDATLATSGELNTERFGPWVFPPLADEVLATSSQPNNAWGHGTPEDAVRRSLYVHVKRSLREPLLASLDQPDPDLPCPVRFPTNVPTQALLTLNGPFVNARAEALAASVLAEADGAADALRTAIENTLGRDATEDEIDRGLTFLESLQSEHDLDEAGAVALFALGLFNRNEFLWID